jgi:hypothetical protein
LDISYLVLWRIINLWEQLSLKHHEDLVFAALMEQF